MTYGLSKALPDLRRLIGGEDLTSGECRGLLNDLMLTHHRDDELVYILAFAVALMAKGPTKEELVGMCMSFADRCVKLSPEVDLGRTVDISGTGGDKIKTINVGTAASFVLAAAGLVVGKQSTRAYTGLTGSRDIFVAFGVDVPMTNGDPKRVEMILQQVGIAPFYYPSFSEKFENRIRFFSLLRDTGLTFVTPWHLVSWVYSPLPTAFRVYGMFTDRYLRAVAGILTDLGVKRGLVIHGKDGLDEASTIGPTAICEFAGGVYREYELWPEDLGVSVAKVDDLLAESADQNVIEFVKVLHGSASRAKTELVAANAGLGLFAAGEAGSPSEGTAKALDLIASGRASEKLRDLVAAAGDVNLLSQWKSKAGI